MGDVIDRLGIDRPIVQAGLGGGIARDRLAAAVSEEGGLGTIGMLDPPRLERALSAARQLTGRPLAVNVLVPFARPRHWTVAQEADVVVTFWGRPRRRTSKVWAHQCGSVAEAVAAHDAGADAIIAQGVEAGGHVRGTVPALELVERTMAALPRGFPVLVAGGIADVGGVRTALDAGARAAVLGTRFLLSEESHAHPAYKQAALAADDTVLTELFGLGWPAPHRVLWNAAARRWLATDARGPRSALKAQRLLSPLANRFPQGLGQRVAASQRTTVPLLSPFAPVEDAPLGRLMETGPLYAGETVSRIHEVRRARELVDALTP